MRSAVWKRFWMIGILASRNACLMLRSTANAVFYVNERQLDRPGVARRLVPFGSG